MKKLLPFLVVALVVGVLLSFLAVVAIHEGKDTMKKLFTVHAKKLLMLALVAGGSLALLVLWGTPGWAGQAVVLSDTELEGVAAGDGLELQDEFTDGDLQGSGNALTSTNTLNGPMSLSGTDQSGQGSSFSTNMSDTSAAQVNQNSAIIIPESDEFFQVLNDQSQQYLQVPYLLNTVGSTNAFLINNEHRGRDPQAATPAQEGRDDGVSEASRAGQADGPPFENQPDQQDDSEDYSGSVRPYTSVQTSIAYSQHTGQNTGQRQPDKKGLAVSTGVSGEAGKGRHFTNSIGGGAGSPQVASYGGQAEVPQIPPLGGVGGPGAPPFGQAGRDNDDNENSDDRDDISTDLQGVAPGTVLVPGIKVPGIPGMAGAPKVPALRTPALRGAAPHEAPSSRERPESPQAAFPEGGATSLSQVPGPSPTEPLQEPSAASAESLLTTPLQAPSVADVPVAPPPTPESSLDSSLREEGRLQEHKAVGAVKEKAAEAAKDAVKEKVKEKAVNAIQGMLP